MHADDEPVQEEVGTARQTVDHRSDDFPPRVQQQAQNHQTERNPRHFETAELCDADDHPDRDQEADDRVPSVVEHFTVEEPREHMARPEGVAPEGSAPWSRGSRS